MYRVDDHGLVVAALRVVCRGQVADYRAGEGPVCGGAGADQGHRAGADQQGLTEMDMAQPAAELPACCVCSANVSLYIGRVHYFVTVSGCCTRSCRGCGWPGRKQCNHLQNDMSVC